MLDGRLLFSSWTLVDSEMGIVSQALGSFHLMFCSLPDCHPLIAGLPSEMRRTTLHLLPSGVPAAGYQRDGKEEKAACYPLCHVPKVNVPQDRAHGFASLLSHPTLHPAAVQRTGNANRLLTSVSLTFYPMVDSAAEVSEYLLVYPLLSFHAWAVIMLIGILILLAYPLLSFHPLVVNEAEENKTNSRLSLLSSHPLVVNKAEENKTSSRLSPLSFHPLVVNEAEENETSSRLSPTIVPPAGSQRSGRGEHASHPPHEVHHLSPPSPVCPTRGSRHRPAWAHHPQA